MSTPCIDVTEVLQHDGGIHSALTQLLLNERQILTYEIQIEHGNEYFIGKAAQIARAGMGKAGT
jgi:hypothetical protein